MTKVKAIELRDLASAVVWWLNYISAIGRRYVINESSIKYPVAEYLERSICEEGKIKLEYNHPILKQKRIDLFFEKNSEQTAFEFKYIKNGSTTTLAEKKRVFNDLMRLHYFLESGGNKAYFLICGVRDEFKNSFYKIPKPKDRSKPNPEIEYLDFYQEWLSFDVNNPDVTINLMSVNEPYREIYKNFFDEYMHINGQKLTSLKEIKTRLVFISQEVVDSKIPENLRIAIWEVLK